MRQSLLRARERGQRGAEAVALQRIARKVAEKPRIHVPVTDAVAEADDAGKLPRVDIRRAPGRAGGGQELGGHHQRACVRPQARKHLVVLHAAIRDADDRLQMQLDLCIGDRVAGVVRHDVRCHFPSTARAHMRRELQQVVCCLQLGVMRFGRSLRQGRGRAQHFKRGHAGAERLDFGLVIRCRHECTPCEAMRGEENVCDGKAQRRGCRGRRRDESRHVPERGTDDRKRCSARRVANEPQRQSGIHRHSGPP